MSSSYEHSELRSRAFGVACHLRVGAQDDKGAELLSLASAELSRLQSKFSAYANTSVISEINHMAGNGEFIMLDRESQSLFEYVSALWQESNHQFDPSAALLKNSNPNGSTAETNSSLMPLVGWSKLELSAEGARLANEGMHIDLDDCIRPYAVDCIRRIFTERGVGSALINLDDDIATIGKQPDGANWLVGVKHPKGGGQAITRLKLNNRSYSIRGNFEQCLTIDGERFGTALSPVDGQAIPGLLSVGVIADTCLAACGAASIAQVKTEQAALKWLAGLGLPWAAIDRQFNCHGLLAK